VSPVTHFFTGWVLGSAVGSNNRERAIVTLAAVVPDVDGFGIIPELLTRQSRHPLLWFSQYHHDLHTLLFAVVVLFGIFPDRSQMDTSNLRLY
jgi:inner membrane protein